MYKEALPAILAIIIILGASGVIGLVLFVSKADAYEQYQKTSLPNIWRKMNVIDFPFDLNKSFEYTLYEVINQGGILEPGEFLKKIYNIFSEHVKKFPHNEYIYEIEINPDPKNFASAQSSEMEVELKVRIKGANVEATKIVKGNLSSDIRAGMLYEKAYMFHKYALEGKPIHCFSWDGNNNKITVTFYSFDNEQGKVRLSWNSTQAEFQNGENGVYQSFNTFETFQCELSDKQSCSLELKLKGNKAIIYRTQNPQESCSGLICENSLPVLIEKGKSYSICINAVNYLQKPLPELINETVENECKDGCLPRSASGILNSCDCDNTPNVEWVLAKAAGCEDVGDCPSSYSNLIPCLKENLRRFIEGYIDKNDDGLKISTRETTDDVKWKIKVILNELNYHYTEGENCPKHWTFTCGQWSCNPCVCPKKESDQGGTESSGNSGSVSTSGVYTKYLFSKYRTNELYWNFSYLDNGKTNRGEIGMCGEHQSTHCPPQPPCGCSPGCTGGGVATSCREKTAYEYAYSYSYDYTYTLEISIKDLKRNIILAE